MIACSSSVKGSLQKPLRWLEIRCVFPKLERCWLAHCSTSCECHRCQRHRQPFFRAWQQLDGIFFPQDRWLEKWRKKFQELCALNRVHSLKLCLGKEFPSCRVQIFFRCWKRTFFSTKMRVKPCRQFSFWNACGPCNRMFTEHGLILKFPKGRDARKNWLEVYVGQSDEDFQSNILSV